MADAPSASGTTMMARRGRRAMSSCCSRRWERRPASAERSASRNQPNAGRFPLKKKAAEVMFSGHRRKSFVMKEPGPIAPARSLATARRAVCGFRSNTGLMADARRRQSAEPAKGQPFHDQRRAKDDDDLQEALRREDPVEGRHVWSA